VAAVWVVIVLLPFQNHTQIAAAATAAVVAVAALQVQRRIRLCSLCERVYRDCAPSANPPGSPFEPHWLNDGLLLVRYCQSAPNDVGGLDAHHVVASSVGLIVDCGVLCSDPGKSAIVEHLSHVCG
jgi:hypothetical protein